MIRSAISTALRRNQFSVLRRSHHHAFAGAAIATESNTTSRDSEAAWMFLASLSLAAATSSIALARCEDENIIIDDVDVDVDDDEVEVEVKEDPYDNLPDGDEPTHCSICLTYRQGPCRPYWKKVEACTKDNELKREDDEKKDDDDDKKDDGEKKNDEEKDDDENRKDEGTDDNKEQDEEESRPDPPCLKYMLPWIDCATSYRDLYALIELDTNYTVGIADLEKDAKLNLCWAPAVEPKVDWSSWRTYVEENDWKLPKKQKSGETSSSEKVSLWKTLDQTKDPEVVQVEAAVAVTVEEGVLECAYAVDQDGNVLGFSYGKKPSEASETTEDDQTAKASMTIRILPDRTRKVIIAAAYTQPKKEDAKDSDPPDSHVYKSRPFSLKKMGKKSP